MHNDTSSPTAIRRRRLLFRATHRGTHETDLLVGGFVERRLERLTEPEMDALEAIMDLSDADLADWLTGRLPIPEALRSPMMLALKDAAGE